MLRRNFIKTLYFSTYLSNNDLPDKDKRKKREISCYDQNLNHVETPPLFHPNLVEIDRYQEYEKYSILEGELSDGSIYCKIFWK